MVIIFDSNSWSSILLSTSWQESCARTQTHEEGQRAEDLGRGGVQKAVLTSTIRQVHAGKVDDDGAGYAKALLRLTEKNSKTQG